MSSAAGVQRRAGMRREFVESKPGQTCPYKTETGALGPVEVYYDRDHGVCVESEKYGMTFCKDYPDEVFGKTYGGDWLSFPTSAGGGCEFDEGAAVYVDDWEQSSPDEIEAVTNALIDQPQAKRSADEIWWPRFYFGKDKKD